MKLFYGLVAVLVCLVVPQSVWADDKEDIAALKAQVADSAARIKNLEIRLLAAEVFGARAGYVAPLAPIPRVTAAPPPVRVYQSVTYTIMPAKVPAPKRGFIGKFFSKSEQGSGCGCYRE